MNVGHCHPDLAAAVKEQADKYFHGMFNVVTHEGYVALLKNLVHLFRFAAQRKKVMFANSGAEADENAVKIAKAYTKRPNIIVFSGAFSRKNDAYDGYDCQEIICKKAWGRFRMVYIEQNTLICTESLRV